MSNIEEFNKNIVNATNALGKSKGNFLVWVFANWCGHCKIMKPAWDDLIKSQPAFHTLAIEGELYKHMWLAHRDHLLVRAVKQVPHYPYLVKIKNGQLADIFSVSMYGHTVEGFKKFMRQ
jgi:thiol-disulfide isomerase/thioredoxin